MRNRGPLSVPNPIPADDDMGVNAVPIRQFPAGYSGQQVSPI